MLIDFNFGWKWVYRARRTWIPGYHVTVDMPSWTTPDPSDPTHFDCVIQERAAVWHALSPYFESHGYHLYRFHSLDRTLVPPILPRPRTSQRDDYPWPRRLWKDERDLEFGDLRVSRQIILSFRNGPGLSKSH